MKRVSKRISSIHNLPPEDQQEFLKMHREMIKEYQDEPERLRGHIEGFNDAVLAIIATIIVLEIKPPIHEVNYTGFISSLLVFLISFAIIADFWYDLHNLFSYFVPHPSSRTAVYDLCLLADLALLPMMTKWIIAEPSGFAVMNYGIIYLIASIFKMAIQYSGFHVLSKNLRTVFLRHSYHQDVSLIVLNLILIVCAFYYPRVVMVLYLSLPLVSEVIMHLQRRASLELGDLPNKSIQK